MIDNNTCWLLLSCRF